MLSDLETYAKKGLEAELVRLDAERERVRALLASLGGVNLKASDRQPAGAKRPRQMSAAGRQAIRDAAKRRWERVRAEAAKAGQGGAGNAEAPLAVATKKRTRKAARTGNRKK
jgi:hypothetical protein